MTGLMDIGVLFLLGAATMLVFLGLFFAVTMPGIDRWSKRFFIAFFLILLLYCCLAILDQIIFVSFPLTSGYRFLLRVLYYFESLFCSVLMPMLTAYLLHCCRIDYRHSGFYHAAVILWIVFIFLLNIAPFSELFYYFTPQNEFVRGPLYSFSIALLGAILGLNVAGAIHWRRRLSRRSFCAFLIGLLPMTVAMFIHMFVSVFTFFGIGIAICALSMFGIILFDQLDQYLRQQQQIAQHHGAADAPAFHLQHNDEHLLSHQAKP